MTPVPHDNESGASLPPPQFSSNQTEPKKPQARKFGLPVTLLVGFIGGVIGTQVSTNWDLSIGSGSSVKSSNSPLVTSEVSPDDSSIGDTVIAQVANAMSDSVVTISSSINDGMSTGEATGTGVVLTADGEILIRGIVGERFCVRNSGATAVVEGVGDHGCEYMTGGTVVILGKTGRNLAAGMSGGITYVLDLETRNVNTEMVDILKVPLDRADELHTIVSAFARETSSPVATELLGNWSESLMRFSMVMPRDYARVLAAIARAEREGLSVEKLVMEVSHG